MKPLPLVIALVVAFAVMAGASISEHLTLNSEIKAIQSNQNQARILVRTIKGKNDETFLDVPNNPLITISPKEVKLLQEWSGKTLGHPLPEQPFPQL